MSSPDYDLENLEKGKIVPPVSSPPVSKPSSNNKIVNKMSNNTSNTNNTSMSEANKETCAAVTSLVCGIIGLFFFGFILGVIAIVFGAVAKNKIKNDPDKFGGHCQANAGLTLGIIDVAVWTAFVIIYLSG